MDMLSIRFATIFVDSPLCVVVLPHLFYMAMVEISKEGSFSLTYGVCKGFSLLIDPIVSNNFDIVAAE